jgi:hypothetical protein
MDLLACWKDGIGRSRNLIGGSLLFVLVPLEEEEC